MEAEGLRVAGELRTACAVERAQGRTAVLVGWEAGAWVIAVADMVKPTSAEAVRRLQALGLRPVLLTGDHEAAARRSAAEVGIDDVVANVLPQRRSPRSYACKKPAITWRWWVTASMTRPRWRNLILVSRSAPARMLQCMPAM